MEKQMVPRPQLLVQSTPVNSPLQSSADPQDLCLLMWEEQTLISFMPLQSAGTCASAFPTTGTKLLQRNELFETLAHVAAKRACWRVALFASMRGQRRRKEC